MAMEYTEALRADVDEENRKLEEKEQELSELKQRLKCIEATTEKLYCENIELKERINKLETLVKEQKEELEQKTITLKEFTKSCQCQDLKIKELEKELKCANAEISTVKEKSSQLIQRESALLENVKKLEEENNFLLNQLKKRDSENSNLVTHIHQLDGELSLVQADNIAKNEEISRLEADLKNSQDKQSATDSLKRKTSNDEDSAPKSKKEKRDMVSPAQTKKPGKERRQIYNIDVPKWFKNSLPSNKEKIFLSVIEINATEKPDENMSFGLLLSKELPKVNNYTYTSIEGRFLVKISTLNAAVHIKEDDLCQIEKYHIRIFEDTPKIKANLMYEPLSSRLQFFICPVYKEDDKHKIDYKAITSTLLKGNKKVFGKEKHLITNIYRLNYLLLAEMLRQKIAECTRIGKMIIPENKEWPIFDFGYIENSKKILKRQTLPPKDVQKTNNVIISFSKNIDFDADLGPSPASILEALTSAATKEESNLERAEFVGDGFLQYVITVKCYLESARTLKRAEMIQIREDIVKNFNLYSKAEDIKLSNIIRKMKFGIRSCIPPLFIIKNQKYEQNLQDKEIADALEALIGTYLLYGGQIAAIKFMEFVKIDVIPNKQNMIITNEDYLLQWPTNYFHDSTENIQETHSEITKVVENTMKYSFKKKNLLIYSATISDKNNLPNPHSHQKLKFLGEAIFYYITSRVLYEEKEDFSPGSLTMIRRAITSKDLLGLIAIKLKLYQLIEPEDILQNMKNFVSSFEGSKEFIFYKEKGYYLTQDPEDPELESPKTFMKMLRRLTLALAGAIYVDTKGCLDIVWNIFSALLQPAIEHFTKNIPYSPVIELQSVLKRSNIFSAIYEEDGFFHAVIKTDEEEFIGVAPKRIQAKWSAANKALSKIGKK